MPCDYTRYPPNWFTEIRPRILLRANNCCERCEAPNGVLIYRPHRGKADWKLAPEGHEVDAMAMDGIKFTKVVLTIAHLDHDPENFEVKDERLEALCQRCHLKLDLPHHINNRKYGRNWKQDQTSLTLE